MGTSEHDKALWYRDSLQIAQAVKQPNGDPARKDPLYKKQGQGEHRVAVITDDMPQDVMTPTFCHTGTDNFSGYGKNDSYKYLDGTRIWVEFAGPNRDCRMKSVLPSHTGKDPGKGQQTQVPPVGKQGR